MVQVHREREIVRKEEKLPSVINQFIEKYL